MNLVGDCIEKVAVYNDIDDDDTVNLVDDCDCIEKATAHNEVGS